MTFAAQMPLDGFLLWVNRCTVYFANEKPQVWLKVESLEVGPLHRLQTIEWDTHSCANGKSVQNKLLDLIGVFAATES